MNKLIYIIPLIFFTSLSADKERERWERELREKQERSQELRSICYKVGAVSGAASFVGGSLAAWLFYFIQSRKD